MPKTLHFLVIQQKRDSDRKRRSGQKGGEIRHLILLLRPGLCSFIRAALRIGEFPRPYFRHGFATLGSMDLINQPQFSGCFEWV